MTIEDILASCQTTLPEVAWTRRHDGAREVVEAANFIARHTVSIWKPGKGVSGTCAGHVAFNLESAEVVIETLIGRAQATALKNAAESAVSITMTEAVLRKLRKTNADACEMLSAIDVLLLVLGRKMQKAAEQRVSIGRAGVEMPEAEDAACIAQLESSAAEPVPEKPAPKARKSRAKPKASA